MDQTHDLHLIRFSTGDVGPAHRLSYWRDMCRTAEIEPLSDRPLEAEATMLALPGVRIGWCRSAVAAAWQRTSEKLRDGDDDFALLLPLSGEMECSQLRHEVGAAPGLGVGVLHSERFKVRFRDDNYHLVVMVPRASLSTRVANLEDASTGLLRGRNEALRLLIGYISMLRESGNASGPELRSLAAQHVQDLVALAVKPHRDEAEAINTGSLRAVRLATIKRDVALNPSLTLTAAAARQGVTPRYVQLLFETEGTTFTAYLSAQRLGIAYRMLMDPHYIGWTISAIALEAGFGDLSHFNRSFKRRFGATPSEIRESSKPVGDP